MSIDIDYEIFCLVQGVVYYWSICTLLNGSL